MKKKLSNEYPKTIEKMIESNSGFKFFFLKRTWIFRNFLKNLIKFFIFLILIFILFIFFYGVFN